MADLNPTAADALTLRLSRDDERDKTFLFGLFAATRAADMAAMPIDAAGKDFLLSAQYRSMTETYRRDYPGARWQIVERGGEPVGLLIAHVGDAYVTYVDIALLPQTQGRGLATRLMRRALEEPSRLGLPARVTVLATNAASLRLCQRLGFAQRSEAPPFVELEWKPGSSLSQEPRTTWPV